MLEGYIHRNLNLKDRLGHKSVLLIGPRQTGKTSYVKNELQDIVALEWNLLRAGTRRRAEEDPDYLVRVIEGLDFDPSSKIVVIDEIQKVPELLDSVHLLIEERHIRFLLTGSSARKLRQNGVNLLGGRASKVHMHPFVYKELSSVKDLSLENIFLRGMLPGAWQDEDADEFLEDYVQTYLQEEIAFEGVVRNLPGFADFLHMAALQSGEELNYSNIANDIRMSSESVSNWYQILEDTLLGYRLLPWGGATKRKTSRTSKFYLFDVGVARNLSGIGVPDESQSDYGRLLETYIAMELKAWLSYTSSREKLCFWRTQRGTYEVDFLVGSRIAIEVKASKRIGKSHLSGLRALEEELHFPFRIVVCREPGPYRTEDGIDVLPWQDFLTRLWNGVYSE